MQHGPAKSEIEIRALPQASLDTVTAMGSLDPPMCAVLRPSGLRPHVFYHYCASKDEPLLVMRHWMALIADSIDQRVAAASYPGQIRAWFASVMRRAQSARSSP